MVAWGRRAVICLHLDAHDEDPPTPVASPALTATGIADALEVGDTAVGRVDLLDDLDDLEAEGLITVEKRSVRGFDVPRPVYRLTERGRERAASLRRAASEETVVVTNGTTAEVRLDDIDRYLDGDAPLVTALTRRTEDGTVPLDTHTGEGFVGRETELGAVRSTIEASFVRESRTVVVGGPPGTGKTALLREALDRLVDDRPELVVAEGACRAETADPYAPFRQACSAIGEEDVQEVLDDARDADTPADPDAAQSQRISLFEDLADKLREISTEQPVVLVLDNLQWADDATLELFVHLATTIDSLLYPIGFAGAYRTSDAVDERNHPRPDALDRIDREGMLEDVRLEPLSRSQTRALLADVFRTQRLPEQFVNLVYERTGGNPLFVRQTARHLLETGQVRPRERTYPTTEDSISVPPVVAEGIEWRLDKLDDRSRELLELGAVIGERIPLGVLAAATDLSPARRREYTDLLVASNVWERVGVERERGRRSRDAELQFVSGSLREAVVEGLSEPRAAEYHDRVAAAIETVAEAGDDVSARIAYHQEQAGHHGAAVDSYVAAGDRASDAYAHEEAIDNFRAALAIARDHGSTDGETVASLHRKIAAAHLTMGEYDRVDAVTTDGLDVAGERSTERCRLLGLRAEAAVRRGEHDRADTAANRQLDLARTLDAPELVADAHRRLGGIATQRGDYDVAREHYGRSLDIAGEIGDREAEAETRMRLGAVAYRRDNYDRAESSFRRALERFRDLDDRKGIARGLGNLGLINNTRGDLEAAHDHYERSLEEYRSIGDRQGEAISLDNLGHLARERKAYEKARDYFRRSLERERELGNRQGEAISLSNLGEIELDLGNNERAREYYEQSLAISRKHGFTHQKATGLEGLASLDLSEGAADSARERARTALDTFEELESTHWMGQCRNLLGDAAEADDRPGDALEHWQAAVQAYESVGTPRDALPVIQSVVETYRAEGDDEAALTWCRRARNFLDEVPESEEREHDWIEAALRELDEK